MTRSVLLAVVAATSATTLAAAVVVVPGTFGGPVGPASRSSEGSRSSASPSAYAAGVSRPAPGFGAAEPGPVARPAAGSPTSLDRARWRWPIRPRPPVLRPFRAPSSPYGTGHRGLDLTAVDGAVVVAVEGGTVTHAGVVAGRGTVTVVHSGGLSSTYEPIGPAVVAGAVVSTGEVLGTMQARDGPAHCGGRTCLHLGARRAGSYLDPHPLLAGGRLALLPLP